MDTGYLIQRLNRLLNGPRLLVLALLLLLSSLYLMSGATEGSATFSQLYIILLVVNVVALIILLALIAAKLYRLLRQYRDNVPGSRMTMRLVAVFMMLSIVPVTVVYNFSLDFLHRGIDSWFDVRVEQALEDSLELSRNALDVRTRELVRLTEQLTLELSMETGGLNALTLNSMRERTEATELALFDSRGHVLATSFSATSKLVPALLNDAMRSRINQGETYIGLDPFHYDTLHMRMAMPFQSSSKLNEHHILQALFPLPARMGGLAENVQQAYTQYKELAYLRQPLKYTFTLTLSLVLLLTMLSAVLAAFYYARRLVAPIRELAEGTRAVADGEYGKMLTPGKNDELGFLVNSFNEMTRRIAQARDEARESQTRLQEQHAYLETLLSRLSSGVLTVNAEGIIHTANTAADAILDAQLGDLIGRHLEGLGWRHPHLAQFVAAIVPHLGNPQQEWREEISLFGPGGRRTLMCSGSALPTVSGLAQGQVIVFDDVTAMIQAQRDAAWGEVARRLAHEIKNPLTPIQLSAERLRHKYLKSLPPRDAETLDRSTHTIVQQVETLKEMVKAFSEYARAPRLNLQAIDLNALINEVLDLYRGHKDIRLHVDLDARSPQIEADLGRIRQLLHNMVKNALEASDTPPTSLYVESHCLQEDACPAVELHVSDNGRGIEPELLAQIFEPYVTTKPKGSGLGLAIVKKIVEEHGGMIRGENRPEGGAHFTIRFPVIGTQAVPNEAVKEQKA
ncbi:MAG: HAMP domain-containing protein [Gammaproteobacteria bacterium]|nr:HAMP domain-containing protein [Gammaproteobacteria bacterium]